MLLCALHGLGLKSLATYKMKPAGVDVSRSATESRAPACRIKSNNHIRLFNRNGIELNSRFFRCRITVNTLSKAPTLRTSILTLRTIVLTLRTIVLTLRTIISTLRTSILTLRTSISTLRTIVLTLCTIVSTLHTSILTLRTGIHGVTEKVAP